MTEEVTEKKEKKVAVVVIESKGQSSLVEWSAAKRLQRGYVPTHEIENGKCVESVLEAAVPYGAEWENYCEKISVTPADIADVLRKSGYWTSGDVERNIKRSQAVIQSLFGINVAAMAKQARHDGR